MDDQIIEQLVKQAVDGLPTSYIYDHALKNVDFKALQTAQPVRNEDIAATFAVAGFAEGIRFALCYLEVEDDGSSDPATVGPWPGTTLNHQ